MNISYITTVHIYCSDERNAWFSVTLFYTFYVLKSDTLLRIDVFGAEMFKCITTTKTN